MQEEEEEQLLGLVKKSLGISAVCEIAVNRSSFLMIHFNREREEPDFQVNVMHLLQTVDVVSTSFLELRGSFKIAVFPRRLEFWVWWNQRVPCSISGQDVVTLVRCHMQCSVRPSAIPPLKHASEMGGLSPGEFSRGEVKVVERIRMIDD